MNFRKHTKYLVFVFMVFVSTLIPVRAEVSDNFGFYANGINEFTHTKYDWRGFDREGNNVKTGTRLDKNGYDWDGYLSGAIYSYSSVSACVGKDGFNHRKFNKHGIHKITATKYDPEGFDCYGFNVQGFNKYTRTKYDIEGYDINGLDKYGYPRTCTISGGLQSPKVKIANQLPPIPPVPSIH